MSAGPAEDVRRRVEDLRRQVEYHSRRYYALDDPEIGDDEYDALFRELQDLEEQHPGLRTPDDRRVRFLNPGLRGGKVISNPWKAQPRRVEKYPESGMREVLLSGSNDHEYSYDARIGGRTLHELYLRPFEETVRGAGYRLAPDGG